MQNNRQESYAALDLGSNSFHLLVAAIHEDQLQIVDKHKEMVRLAAGFDVNNQLTTAKQSEALACLSRMGQRISHLPATHVRILGTNALRMAANSRDFLRKARELLGHPVDVISGREEARLLYLGVAHTLPTQPGSRLVMDIGGGSTELILGNNFNAEITESLHMGCVSMSLKYLGNGQLSASGWEKARTAALLELQPVLDSYASHKWVEAIGASGTFKAIARVLQQEGWSEFGISREGLQQLKQRILSGSEIDQVTLNGLEKERRPVFAGGVAIVEALFDAFDLTQVNIAEGALREGVVYDLAGRLHHNDIRERSVSSLAERFNVDEAQANRVAAVVNRLVVNSESLELEHEDSEMLYWAARLHEIGLTISHSNFQKHGAYLIQHADIPGFSKQEQNLLGFLVLAQRRKFPAHAYAELNADQRMAALKPCVILRLALLLCRNRHDPDVSMIQLLWKEGVFTLGSPEGWLESNPLYRADLKQEQKYLRRADIELTIRQN